MIYRLALTRSRTTNLNPLMTELSVIWSAPTK